ncbi:MAG: hypothetical protein BWY64_03321 [bacterium ADurb.Bin363]|nr:MAG: hypothetical protein BWY64_03321 [bacterium ADurb.Bin363]
MDLYPVSSNDLELCISLTRCVGLVRESILSHASSPSIKSFERGILEPSDQSRTLLLLVSMVFARCSPASLKAEGVSSIFLFFVIRIRKVLTSLRINWSISVSSITSSTLSKLRLTLIESINSLSEGFVYSFFPEIIFTVPALKSAAIATLTALLSHP